MSNRKGMKEAWKVFNKLINTYSKTTNINSLNIVGKLITDKSDISNAMNDHFCSNSRNLFSRKVLKLIVLTIAQFPYYL